MKEIKQKAIAVVAKDLYTKLQELGVKIPDNCADIIIEARVGDVVNIYYRCFADQETVDAMAAVMLKVNSELAEPHRFTDERAQRMFSAYWRTTTGLTGDGWKDAWELLADEQKGGWYQAVHA